MWYAILKGAGVVPKKSMITKEQLYQDYVVDDLSIKTIAKKRHSSTNTIRAYLKEYNIPKRPRGLPSKIIPKDELKRLYEEQQVPVSEIATIFDSSEPTIHNYIKKYNLVMRNKINEIPSSEELHELYIHDELSLDKVGEIFGVSGPTVKCWLDSYGIKTRGHGSSN